jgi:hypothetical protein
VWVFSLPEGRGVIVVRMQGGLGNQFFQYAAGRALSLRLETPLWLDVSWYRRLPRRATPRLYELWRYRINAKMLDGDDLSSPFFLTQQHLGAIVCDRGRVQFAKSFRERSFSHDPRMEQLQGSVYLDGYWQSPLYFAGHEDCLRFELQPDVLMGVEDERIARMMNDSVSVAVHVRRGDYVAGPHARQHGVCDLRYYREAVACMRRELRAPRFFLFSDDPEWVRGHAELFGDAVVVSHNEGVDAFQDLRLMTLCQGHVIANSTFSWWGAWLCDRTDKLVVAPTKWFDGGEPTPTLIPPTWRRL